MFDCSVSERKERNKKKKNGRTKFRVDSKTEPYVRKIHVLLHFWIYTSFKFDSIFSQLWCERRRSSTSSEGSWDKCLFGVYRILKVSMYPLPWHVMTHINLGNVKMDSIVSGRRSKIWRKSSRNIVVRNPRKLVWLSSRWRLYTSCLTPFELKCSVHDGEAGGPSKPLHLESNDWRGWWRSRRGSCLPRISPYLQVNDIWSLGIPPLPQMMLMMMRS